MSIGFNFYYSIVFQNTHYVLDRSFVILKLNRDYKGKIKGYFGLCLFVKVLEMFLCRVIRFKWRRNKQL